MFGQDSVSELRGQVLSRARLGVLGHCGMTAAPGEWTTNRKVLAARTSKIGGPHVTKTSLSHYTIKEG